MNRSPNAAENLGEHGHWLILLRSQHTGLRRLVGLGLVLFVAVVADWGFQHERLADETPLLISSVKQLGVKEPFMEEGRRLFEKHRDKATLIVEAPLRALPQLLDAVARRVDKELPLRGYRLGRFELPLAYYRLALVVAPPVILGLVLLKLRTVRKLRRILASFASDMGEVQQVLNSPFYERITRSFGEGRSRHALMVLLLHVPMLVSAFMYVPAVMNLQGQNFGVLIDSAGAVMPADDSAFVVHRVPTQLALVWGAVIVLSVAAWIGVAFQAARKP